MDFAMSAKAQDYQKRLSAFMTEFVFPAEAEYERYRIERGSDDHTLPPIVARSAGSGTITVSRKFSVV